MQYIIGNTKFYGLTLKVDPRALIPRHETEELIELIVERLDAPPKRILDLGTGSGAIALALALRDTQTLKSPQLIRVRVPSRSLKKMRLR